MLESIRLSYRSLREARTLTTMSIQIALGLLLGLVTLVPNEFLKIGLGFTVTSAMGFLFGPVPACLGAGAIDVLRFFLRPTGPYFFGFTFNALLTGTIYGLLLYHRRPTFWRCLLTKGVVSLTVNVILSTLWLAVLYGQAINVLLPVRLIKNAVALPVEAAIMFFILKTMERVRQVQRK